MGRAVHCYFLAHLGGGTVNVIEDDLRYGAAWKVTGAQEHREHERGE